MTTIIVANTNNEVKEAIQKGCRFKIAPSVTHVQVDGANINYENVAEALQNSSSVKHLLVNLEQLSSDSKFELLIAAVSSSRVLESMVISTKSDNTIAAIGQLLQQNSSISVLHVISDREIRSAEFFAGLKENKSLHKVRLHIRKWREIGIKAAQELYKRLVFSLGNNKHIQKFNVQTGRIGGDNKSPGGKDLASDGVTSIDQVSHLEIFIEREQTPKEMIHSGNWDKLSVYIKENCHEMLDEQIYLPEFSLVTKNIVANLAVQSLTELAEERSAKKKSDEQEIQATRQQVQSLTDKITHLKNQLAKLELEKSVADQRLKDQTDMMSLALSREKLLNDQLSTFQKHVATTEPAMKKWQSLRQTDLHKWTCEDVLMLLSEINLGTYSDIFLANKIDGAVLTTLDANDMMTALNLSFKEAKALQKQIYLLQVPNIYMVPTEVLEWNNKAVCTWLQNHKFGHLVDVFQKHQITGTELVFLEKIDITHHLQINALGDIVNLQKAISILKDSLQNEQREFDRRKNNNNNDNKAENELQRQLEEMKLANETLSKTLKEREAKVPMHSFVLLHKT